MATISRKLISVWFTLIILGIPLSAQEMSTDYNGFYIHVFNQFELVQYYPDDKDGSNFWLTDTFQTVGFEFGKYKGAQSFGVLIAYGFEDSKDDGNLRENEAEFDSYWRLGGVFSNRIIGTKTSNSFRFQLGGTITAGFQRTRGERGTGEVFVDRVGLTYPVRKEKVNSAFIEFGPHIQIGSRLKKSGSIFLTLYPIGLNASTSGIGLNVGRVGLVVQL